MRTRIAVASAAAVVLLAGSTVATQAVAASGPTPKLATAGSKTAGCGKAPSLTNGTKTISGRTYILSLPSNYDQTKAYRLVLGLHWLNGSSNDVATGGQDGSGAAFYGQKTLHPSDTIFVAPEGTNHGWPNSNNADLNFIDSVIKQVEDALCVDTSLVFSMGWSYGGSMSYALACARPTVIRAVVVYSGAQLSGCNGGTQPVAYFGIHGIHDSVLNISMGRQIRDTFVKANGCTAASPSEPRQGSLTHTTYTYTGCKAGYPVQWAAFDGDHTPSPIDGTTQTNGSRTWTSAAANTFLSQFTSTIPA